MSSSGMRAVCNNWLDAKEEVEAVEVELLFLLRKMDDVVKFADFIATFFVPIVMLLGDQERLLEMAQGLGRRGRNIEALASFYEEGLERAEARLRRVETSLELVLLGWV